MTIHEFLEKPEPEVRLDEALGHGQKYEVRFFILPSGISPKESRHIVNQESNRAPCESRCQTCNGKEIVYLEKNNRLEKSNLHGNENISSVLQSNPLFSTLPKQEINHLTGYFKVSEYLAGENLYRQGNEGGVMYVLIEGLHIPRLSMMESKHLHLMSKFSQVSILVRKVF